MSRWPTCSVVVRSARAALRYSQNTAPPIMPRGSTMSMTLIALYAHVLSPLPTRAQTGQASAWAGVRPRIVAAVDTTRLEIDSHIDHRPDEDHEVPERLYAQQKTRREAARAQAPPGDGHANERRRGVYGVRADDDVEERTEALRPERHPVTDQSDPLASLKHNEQSA